MSGVDSPAPQSMLIRIKPATLRWRNLPISLFAFLGLAVISVAWLSYRLETLLGTLILLGTNLVAVSCD